MMSGFGKQSLQYPISKSFPLDIVGPTAFGRYSKISSEETFNMIISDGSLVPFDGYRSVIDITESGKGREIYTSTKYNHIIVVVNDGVYTISQSFSVSKIGNLDTSVGNVFIAENLGGQIGIVDGLNIYIFDYINNTFDKAIVDFLPVSLAFQDTYFIAADGRTNQWRLSDSNNGNIWPADGAHVGELQTKATNCVFVAAVDRQLFVCGKTCIEPWYDVGYTLFPYQRTNFYSIDYGVLSVETIASGFGKLVWLAANEKSGISLMSSEGGQPQRISNDGLDFVFNNFTNPSDSFGFLFRSTGHVFYLLTFKTDNRSFLYDFNTNSFFTVTDPKMDHHIAKRITFFNQKYYFISFDDTKLYQMDPAIYTYDGEEIPRYRICKHIRLPGGDNFVVQNAHITMEQGFSRLPQVIDISSSHDGGYSYQNITRKTLNPLGKRPNTFNARSLGCYNDCTLKFGFWGFERFVINDAQVSIYQ